MNRKRNVNYIKPEDPQFLKDLKKQAGYDDQNHKFDPLENSESDFVDDEDSEKPQVVVLKEGDLTAEQAEIEKSRIEKLESETKADLNQRVIFNHKNTGGKRKQTNSEISSKKKTKKPVLSFDNEEGSDADDDIL